MAKSKAKSKRNKHLVAVLVIVLLVAIIISVWFLGRSSPQDDNPNIRTISTGTQLRFESLNVGLGDIQGNSATLAFHQDGTSNEMRKTVTAGDKFEIYGYTVEVKAVEKAFNPSRLIGASQGDVKFLINKQ